tara:strand:+ start:2364 stop:2810 length:447 start_codon:yes stop_codon:yes gene_type:complete
MKNSGSCHCKAVSFETDLDPMLVAQCNCNNCRKMSGSVRIATMYAADEIEFTGETDVYTYSGGSGNDIHSHFCKKCNTNVFNLPTVMEGMVSVPLGVFENSTQFKPKLEIWTSTKLDWLKDDGCIMERVEDSGVAERLMTLLESLENR